MELRPSLLLPAAVKALQDVVLPAVDPSNKLAQEQAHLVIGTLQLLIEREPLRYRYERDELSRFIALAKTLQEKVSGLDVTSEAVCELSSSVASGEDVLGRARAEPSELETTNLELRDKICALVNTLGASNPMSSLKGISAAITAHAQEQLRKERTWLVAQGWEPDPKSLPPLETQLEQVPR